MPRGIQVGDRNICPLVPGEIMHKTNKTQMDLHEVRFMGFGEMYLGTGKLHEKEFNGIIDGYGPATWIMQVISIDFTDELRLGRLLPALRSEPIGRYVVYTAHCEFSVVLLDYSNYSTEITFEVIQQIR